MQQFDAGARDRILSQARVVVAMGGRPTVEDFAAAAGVSRATFYRAFKSRNALLEALQRAPEPSAADRILQAALTIVGERGLTALSMDELADQARVSRATLYRLFPGKSAVFAALVHAFSPLDPVVALVESMRPAPPEKVIPEIARTVYATVYTGKENRTGLLRALFFEVSSLSPDAEEAIRGALVKVVATLISYLDEQMAAGRLRRMHPLLALQSLIGPIFFHLVTRDTAERILGVDFSGEQAVTELANTWLRAMAPTEVGR